MRIPPFPRVHTHFYYKIQYQNSPGSILLNKAIPESQSVEMTKQNPQGCPPPSPHLLTGELEVLEHHRQAD